MKTPEEILKQHAPGIILFGAGDGSVHKWNAVIKAMEEYAVQSVGTATANAVHQIDMKQEELDQEKELVATLQGQVVDVTLERDELDEQYKLAVARFKDADNRSREMGTKNAECWDKITQLEGMLTMSANAFTDLRKDTINILTRIQTADLLLTPRIRAEINNFVTKLLKE